MSTDAAASVSASARWVSVDVAIDLSADWVAIAAVDVAANSVVVIVVAGPVG